MDFPLPRGRRWNLVSDKALQVEYWAEPPADPDIWSVAIEYVFSLAWEAKSWIGVRRWSSGEWTYREMGSKIAKTRCGQVGNIVDILGFFSYPLFFLCFWSTVATGLRYAECGNLW